MFEGRNRLCFTVRWCLWRCVRRTQSRAVCEAELFFFWMTFPAFVSIHQFSNLTASLAWVCGSGWGWGAVAGESWVNLSSLARSNCQQIPHPWIPSAAKERPAVPFSTGSSCSALTGSAFRLQSPGWLCRSSDNCNEHFALGRSTGLGQLLLLSRKLWSSFSRNCPAHQQVLECYPQKVLGCYPQKVEK